MPLTDAGKKTLANFIKEYGEEEGKKYFYAYMNKNKNKSYTKKLHEMKGKE